MKPYDHTDVKGKRSSYNLSVLHLLILHVMNSTHLLTV